MQKSQYQPPVLAHRSREFGQPKPLYKYTTQGTLTCLGATLSNPFAVGFTKIRKAYGQNENFRQKLLNSISMWPGHGLQTWDGMSGSLLHSHD
jgi:hypothetical protein